MGDIISVGLWIKRRRKALDLTQNELGQRVGCALETIRKIEMVVGLCQTHILSKHFESNG